MFSLESLQDFARYVCKILSIFVMGLMIYYVLISNKIYNIMHENKERKHNLHDLPQFKTICVMPIASAISLHILKRQLISVSVPIFKTICKDQDDPVKLEKRAHTAATYLYKEIFYLSSSILGYLIMYDSPVLPRWMGGKGSIEGIFNGMPY